MKKLVLILIAGVSFAKAHAQIQFGVKAGANLATFTGNGTTGADISSIAGFNGGVFVKMPIAGSVSFSPELLYSGKGAKVTITGEPDVTLHVNYLDIPLLFKYTHASGFHIETGPQVGILLTAKGKVQGVSVDDKNSYNSAEFAWDFGLGYDIPNTPVGIEFRYNLGISNIAKTDANSSNTNDKLHNSVFQFGLRYTLFGSTGKSSSTK